MQDLSRHSPNLGLCDPAMRLQVCGQLSTGNVLHDDVYPSVVFVMVDVLDDIGLKGINVNRKVHNFI